jgi:hypothetical protein
MPVVFATESMPDSNHPVFKANIAVSNVASNGIQVYPHVYIRVIFVGLQFFDKQIYTGSAVLSGQFSSF